MNKLVGAAVLVGLVAGGIVLVAARPRKRDAGSGHGGSAAGRDGPASRPPDRTEVPRPIASAAGAASGPGAAPPARERPRLEPLDGVLAGYEAGAPAVLAWTPLFPELDGVEYIHSIDFERLRVATVTAASEASGRFRFPAVPDEAAGGGSVVWITQPGREARAVLLGPAETVWPASAVSPASGGAPAREPVRVVVQRAGAPVAGARLRHTLSFWEPGQSEAERRPRRVFVRDARTDGDGAATIVPGSGENALLAEDGDELSLLWIGVPEGVIELELLPTFALQGRIVTEDPALALGDVRIHAGCFSTPDRSDMIAVRGSHGVRADGSFGPHLLPRARGTHLYVYSAGGECLPAHTEIANPTAGGSAHVELRTARAHAFELAITDPAGAPLAGALVRAQHWTEDTALPLQPEPTDADGRAVLRSPAGQLHLQITKSRYTTLDVLDQRAFVPRKAGPLSVVLRPAGVVAGWVHHASEPVERFTVVAWNEDRSYCPLVSIEDDEGAFRLEDVPQGETVHVVAFADHLPQSEPQIVMLGAEPREVEIELPAPRKARGRVIDSLTHEPIPGATIHHLAGAMSGFSSPRGKPMGVRADGGFELQGFFPGRGGFTVAASGYESLHYDTREAEGDPIDLGLLVLQPLCVLDVRVRETGVADFTGYRAWNRFNDSLAPVELLSDGSASVPSRSGPFELTITRPDGHATWVSGVVLAGETKRVEVELGEGIELAARVEDAPEDVASWNARAYSCARDETRCADGAWSGEPGAFVFRGLCPGDVVIELRDRGDEPIVQRSLRLSEAPRQTVTLERAGERRRLRLVDGRGRPWKSCSVVVMLATGSGWYALRESDGEGELEIGPLDAREVVLSAKLANESIAYGVPVALDPDPARTTVVELEVGARSLVLLVEEGRPCGGITIAYRHDRVPNMQFSYSSGEDGLVRGPFLGPGTHQVRVNNPRYWPTDHAVTARDSAMPLALELFSRASLAVTVTTPEGRPVAGAKLALEHQELGGSVADWVAAGRVAAPSGLVTESDGLVVLEGLPRGTYSWSCTSPSGARASGTARLAPSRRQELSVSVRVE